MSAPPFLFKVKRINGRTQRQKIAQQMVRDLRGAQHCLAKLGASKTSIELIDAFICDLAFRHEAGKFPYPKGSSLRLIP